MSVNLLTATLVSGLICATVPFLTESLSTFWISAVRKAIVLLSYV